MKRFICFFATILLIFSITFAAMPITSSAQFDDLKKYGVSMNLNKGNWVAVYTKLPGKKGLTKLFAKITKLSIYEIPAPKAGAAARATNDSTMTAVLTVQVQYPQKPSKKIAKALMNEGHDVIDYMDVVVVDKFTGENLNTQETSEEGSNYHGVSVKETEWKGLKPQKLTWSNGTVYQYYVSYVKTLVIKFPSGYKNTCLGVCGSHVGDYNKMQDWNEGFIEGYTAFSDTSHVKLGSKKKTSQLSHFFNIKKKAQEPSNPFGIRK
ncbi:hypothetical protein [Butyrivibrio sp. WCE2006]|uniref:hypothetical protein n=1 Tax=Butyrivibrio sp. WCE2006 TaxID=1410611 RepID=UPI0005D2649E|nr:hypothetical protein [Butyrivibrio sp. WCE2006]